jgi:hypothetical protein
MRLWWLAIVFAVVAIIFIFWPKECGYNADFIRMAGQNVEDKTCNCFGIIYSQPFWVSVEIDGLAHTYCYGVKAAGE